MLRWAACTLPQQKTGYSRCDNAITKFLAKVSLRLKDCFSPRANLPESRRRAALARDYVARTPNRPHDAAGNRNPKGGALKTRNEIASARRLQPRIRHRHRFLKLERRRFIFAGGTFFNFPMPIKTYRLSISLREKNSPGHCSRAASCSFRFLALPSCVAASALTGLRICETSKCFFSPVTIGELQVGIELTRRQDPAKGQ